MEIVESASRKMVDAVHRSIHDHSRLARELSHAGSDRSSANCHAMKSALGYACFAGISTPKDVFGSWNPKKYEFHVGDSIRDQRSVPWRDLS
jgi:hypothetical protein